MVKLDKAGEQNLIYVGANNFTLQNTTISGQYVLGDGDVSRAMVVTLSNISGLQIIGNTIYGLRQPGYLNGSLAAPTTGVITGNLLYGTRGWVIDGANMTFSANTRAPEIIWICGNTRQYTCGILHRHCSSPSPTANNDASIED